MLRQPSVDDKSNEIIATTKLLSLLELKDAIISIDAMESQKQIAKQVVDRGGEYVLAVKDNQPTLHAAIDTHFVRIHKSKSPDILCHLYATHKTAHGCTEDRYCYISELPKSLSSVKKVWSDIRSVSEVITINKRDKKETYEVRHFITSFERK